MSHAFTDGLPQLEAIHKWTSGHRLAPTVTLNDLSATPWRVLLEEIDGLGGRAPRTDSRQSHRGRAGSQLGPTHEEDRVITYSGLVQGKTRIDMRQGFDALDEAFEEADLEGAMQVLIDDQGTPVDYWIYTGRVLDFAPVERQVTTDRDTWPYQREFTLAITCSDPRIYWSHAISGGPNATQVTLTNPGRDTNPLVTVNADGTADVTIFNDTTGRKLKFASAGWGSALVITFDFHLRLIWVNDPGGTPFVDGNAYGDLLLTSESDWWHPGEPGIDRGANTIRQTGGDDISVYFTPAV